MTLTGVINTLGGFSTIRGYAPLSDIANISEAEEFQRDLIPEHKQEIREFYKRKKDLFFPEIVLSHTLKYNFEVPNAKSGINPLKDILDKKEFVSNIDEIKFKPLKQETGNQRIVTITINDKWLKDDKNKKPFSRIDGNHRISAYLEEYEYNPLDEYMAPFCILLLNDEESSKKSKKIVFHNINSKARTLTTEEELNGIISNKDFNDNELKEIFGENYYYTRMLLKKLNSDISSAYPNIYKSFLNASDKECKNTVLFKLIKFLHKNDLIKQEDDIVSKIYPAIQKINNEFYEKERLISAKNSAFLISSIGIELKNMNVNSYIKWLSKNQLGELNEVKAQSIFDIYVKIHQHNPKIFVAMPYFSKDEIDAFNQAYQRVVEKINTNSPNANLELIPIMIHQGGTKDIVTDMFNKINSSDIFIADISKANANVAYELGYARSKNIKTIIVRREGDNEQIPFDYEHDVHKKYNPKAINTLEEIVYDDIKSILIEKGYSIA